MFYKEIEPGIFLSEDNKIHYKLVACPYCGGMEVMSHSKYTDRCVDCGNLYNLYSVRRSARRRGKLSDKAILAHMDIIKELLNRRKLGYNTPETLDEEATVTSGLIDQMYIFEEERRAALTYTEASCSYCNADMNIVEGDKPPHRCKECEKRYKQYKAMYDTISILELEECDALAKLIRYYIKAHDKGFVTPQYTKAIKKLQARMDVLGAPHYKFYRLGGFKDETV